MSGPERIPAGRHDQPRARLRGDALPAFLGLSAVLGASVLLPMPGRDGRILHLPPLCPFYALTGLPCPGCGLTRAFVCLGHGHWAESLHWHPVGGLVYGVFVLLWLRLGATLTTGRAVLPIAPPVAQRAAWLGALGLLLVGAIRIACLTAHHLRF